MTPLKPILYFSLFRYPLTEEEIFAFSEFKDRETLRSRLQHLLEDKIIYKIGDFYLPENNPHWVDRRLKGNENARQVYSKANRVSKFISKFPYVKGVAISGSLSKGYYDDNGDIDFFIITAKNRLWIARTLLILYKKLFLFNSKKYFCVNYFVGENSLELEEKNRFTATELVTMMPMYCNGSFRQFYKSNDWAYSILPNKEEENDIQELRPIQKPLFSRSIEKILSNGMGDRLDRFFLQITFNKWKRKFSSLDEKNFKVAMKSNRNVSKHHPQNFQRKVIDQLNEKYVEYEKKYNIMLPLENA